MMPSFYSAYLVNIQRLQLFGKLLQPAGEFFAEFPMAHGVFHIGLHITELAAAIVARPFMK